MVTEVLALTAGYASPLLILTAAVMIGDHLHDRKALQDD